jgi:hypothetical protein
MTRLCSCVSGARADQARAVLETAGLDQFSGLKGGVSGWEREGGPRNPWQGDLGDGTPGAATDAQSLLLALTDTEAPRRSHSRLTSFLVHTVSTPAGVHVAHPAAHHIIYR